MGLFGQPAGRALGLLRPRVLKGAGEMGFPWTAYYVLTKTQASLPNSKIHPNSGTPDYNISHAVADISDIDTAYLKIDGSNANTAINIGDNSLSGSSSSIFTAGVYRGDWVDMNLIPQVDYAYTLGDATHQWADLWLAGDLSDGTNSLSVASAKLAYDYSQAHTTGITIDGGSSVITTGIKGAIQIPFDATIVSWTILSTDASITSGSIVVDIWKDALANYPPTVADTITASAKPTLTTATSATSSTLTGWTTSVTAGDVLLFNVDSVTSVKRITLLLKLKKV